MSTPAIWPASQPLVDMQSGMLIGFEVLARWTDCETGAISPSEFISVAETDDLINALTEKIVSEACRQAREWPGAFVLAIKLSAAQFREPHLFEFIRSTVQAAEFPLDRIRVKIAESVLLDDDETVRSKIALLKSAGISLALDDFGTGCSSLIQLHRFPLDKLKIEMSFVRSMHDSNDSRKIVASVIGLGQSLGMAVIAEGVETEEQATILRRLGCDVGQGLLFGKPRNGAQTAAWLKQRSADRFVFSRHGSALCQRQQPLRANV